MPTRAVIRFFAPVIDVTVNALLNAVDAQMRQGVTEICLLISCPGGSVFHGLSAYNYLRGLPIKVVTHNFGSVDSIGVVMYCGGSERFSVPQARFLLHGVNANFAQSSLEEKQLEERLKGLRIDMTNIARVIAECTGKTEKQVMNAMLERTTLDPDQARSWGLVDEVKSELFESGLEVISIQAAQKQK